MIGSTLKMRTLGDSLDRDHRPLLLQMARRLCRGKPVDPEDLVQDTFERALRNLGSVPAAAGAPLRGWLCAALLNRFLDRLRRRRTEQAALAKLHALQMEHAQPAVERERLPRHQLQAALGRLSPRQREVYALRAAGLRYREISERLAVPIGSVGSWLAEARSGLRKWERKSVQ